MAALLEKFRQYYAGDGPATDTPAAFDNMYEQYRTANLVTVFQDLYPSANSTQEQKDALAIKRMEVAKSAKGLEREKKLFTAENEKAAKGREEAGVKIHDFAYGPSPHDLAF